jgi:CHAD domain-containing protein
MIQPQNIGATAPGDTPAAELYLDTEDWTLARAGIALRLHRDGAAARLVATTISTANGAAPHHEITAPNGAEWTQEAPAGDPPWGTLGPGPVASLLQPLAGLHVLERLAVAPAPNGETPPERDERAYAPHPADRLLDVAHKTLGRHFARLLWNEPGVRLGIEPERVHDMRVASRRLRAALEVLGEGMPEAPREEFKTHLRWIGRALGRVRDLDVAIARVQALEAEGTSLERPALRVFAQSLAIQRAERRLRLIERLDSERFANFVVGARAWIDAGPWPADSAPGGAAPAYAVGTGIVARFVDTMREAYVAAERSLATEDLHALRMAAKMARYAIEFFAEPVGPAALRRAKRIAGLQDFLGDHRDAETLARRLKRYACTIPKKDRELVMSAGSAAGHLEREIRIHRADLRVEWEKAVEE